MFTSASRLLLPPVRAEEWDESDGRDVGDFNLRPATDDELEGLLVQSADRYDHAPAIRQLLDERLRDGRSARAHEDGVVGRILAPSDRPIAQQHRDVLRAGARDVLAADAVQRRDSLDGEDLRDQ